MTQRRRSPDSNSWAVYRWSSVYGEWQLSSVCVGLGAARESRRRWTALGEDSAVMALASGEAAPRSAPLGRTLFLEPGAMPPEAYIYAQDTC